MRADEFKKLKKAIDYLYSDEDDSFTGGMNELLGLYNSALKERKNRSLTKRIRNTNKQFNPRDVAILGGDPSL